MGVRKEHGVHALRIESQVPIVELGLLAAPLEHAAIEQNPRPTRLDEVSAAGDRFCRSVKAELHDGETWCPGWLRWITCQASAAVSA